MSATTRAFLSRPSPVSLRRNRPPTTSERERILDLIREDNELIHYLLEKATQRSLSAAQASASVEQWKVGLVEAEKRLETATSLHDFFIKNHKNSSALDELPPPASGSSESAVGPRSQFDSLLAIADSYIQSTRAVIEQAALAVQEARDSVATQRDELQAAMTISMMHQQGHAVLQEQVEMLKRSVEEKQSAFRAIWRVPGEIWRMVFEEAVSDDETEMQVLSLEKSWNDGRESGCETLRLSGVCHNWRSLITSYPDLWSHIYMPNYVKSSHLARIHHYYGLCNRSRLRLTVLSSSDRDTRCFKLLYNLFYTGTSCQKLTLLIRAAGVPAVNLLLPNLPPPVQLAIIRYPYVTNAEENERTPTPTIPRSHCNTIRELEISAAGAIWTNEPTMRLERYNIVAPPISAIFGPHRFIPSSLQTLTSIGIQGRFYDPQPLSTERKCLPDIQETTMSLHFLVTMFMRHYTVPSLRKLVIPAGSSVTTHEWQEFLTEAQINSFKIKEVCCYSFDEHIDSLVDCLITLRQIERLELQGSCVDLMLEQLVVKMDRKGDTFPDLQNMVICSYSGDGTSIRVFIEVMCQRPAVGYSVDEEEVVESGRRIVLALQGCPAISSENMKVIRQLAHLVY
ncbi:hypothetical protein M408DRAFT_329864 [Serendipita vermifera MAFF 305830]|uniref:F-box domain-containing protein n=1 Tax=Serendipita vermifera MAFF 305830 TaxID=933852 RepID=A0A0C2WN24_SERVB|nr:hypothetical protein M408DRAFT_329864 [Serendipita vermifera MAFF 305830]